VQTVDGQSDGLKTSRKNNKNDEEALMKVKPTFYLTKQKNIFLLKKKKRRKDFSLFPAIDTRRPVFLFKKKNYSVIIEL